MIGVTPQGRLRGDLDLKIELTRVPAEQAERADNKGEAWVRVLTNTPIGPQAWDEVSRKLAENHDWFFGTYEAKPEKFFTELTDLEEGETGYDAEGLYGWEQWFTLAEKRIYT